jgi:splicing factor 3B subunit 3
MDLGLNVVIRKHMYPVDFTAHQLVSIPDCPGGVLVICKGFLIYKKPDHEDIYC